MKKNLYVLFLTGILLITSTIATSNSVSAASDSLPIGIYIDGKLNTTIPEFKKLKIADKTKLLMTKGAYLSLGKELLETKNIIEMNDYDLDNSKITVAEYERIVNGGQVLNLEVLSIK